MSRVNYFKLIGSKVHFPRFSKNLGFFERRNLEKRNLNGSS